MLPTALLLLTALPARPTFTISDVVPFFAAHSLSTAADLGEIINESNRKIYDLPELDVKVGVEGSISFRFLRREGKEAMTLGKGDDAVLKVFSGKSEATYVLPSEKAFFRYNFERKREPFVDAEQNVVGDLEDRKLTLNFHSDTGLVLRSNPPLTIPVDELKSYEESTVRYLEATNGESESVLKIWVDPETGLFRKIEAVSDDEVVYALKGSTKLEKDAKIDLDPAEIAGLREVTPEEGQELIGKVTSRLAPDSSQLKSRLNSRIF